MQMSDNAAQIVKPIDNNNLIKRLIKYRVHFLVLLPTLIFFAVFSYAPMYGVILAFKDFNLGAGIIKSPWVDPLLKHFNRMFSSSVFINAMRNTLIISSLKIFLAFPLPIIFAILIDEMPFKILKKSVQTISYFPYFISWIVLGGIIRAMLSPTNGVINYIIVFFGGTARHLLADKNFFKPLVFITHVWQTVGYSSVVYLAAIANIDQEQYDAAYIDGASRFNVIRHITIPSITPIMSILFILGLGGILNAGFDQIFNLYSPVVYSTADIIDTYTYRVGLVDMQFSFSTAVGLFKNVIGFILVLSANLIIGRIDKEKSLF